MTSAVGERLASLVSGFDRGSLLTRQTEAGGFLLEGPGTLTGALRGSGEPLSAEGRIVMAFDAAPHPTNVSIALDPSQVTRIAARASTP